MKRGGENQTFLERAVFSFRAENGSERKKREIFPLIFFFFDFFSFSSLSPLFRTTRLAQPERLCPLALARPPSPLRESLGSFLRAPPPIPPGSRAPLVEERRGSHSPREPQRSPGLAAVLLPPSRLWLRNRRVSRAPRLPLFLRPLAFPSRRFPAAFATFFLSASRQCRAWKRQRPGHRKKRPPSCFLPPKREKSGGKQMSSQPATRDSLFARGPGRRRRRRFSVSPALRTIYANDRASNERFRYSVRGWERRRREQALSGSFLFLFLRASFFSPFFASKKSKTLPLPLLTLSPLQLATKNSQMLSARPSTRC